MIQLDSIAQKSKQMNGQPCLRNLLLMVRCVIEIAALHPDRAEWQAESNR
jgi:uncharacterized protein (DUF433 family)